MKIEEFQGTYRWLSNFWPVPIVYDGITYESTEVAYQAAKTNNRKVREIFAKLTAAESKTLGQNIIIRPDWDAVKLDVMEEVLRYKFSNSEMRRKLIATGDAELIEGNNWNDTFWGVCKGVGQNHLGKLIMKIRDEINGK